jgi:DNA replication and repair protein RecF
VRLAVTGLRLSHFRSHLSARLAPDGRAVAIFGPNGAGKTNILEAVSLLSPGRGLRRAAADEIVRRPEGLGWKVSAVLESLGREHEVETWAEPGGARQVRIDGKAAAQVALGRVARIVWLTPAMDRLWTEGADGRRRFLDRIAMSFEPSHAEAVLDYEKAMRERNRLLRDQVADARWYDVLEAQMAASGTALRENRAMAVARLLAAQAGAETAFPAAGLALVGPEGGPEEPGEDLASALAASRAGDLRAGRTLVGPHRADLAAVYAAKGVPAEQCSTGEQKALLLSLVLANARALAQDFGAPPILLLDEVAAHLDAGRRAALYDEVCGLGAQAWMTGTGPELFEALGDRAQRLEVREALGVSEIVGP